jgi:type I restriction enzyme M protein
MKTQLRPNVVFFDNKPSSKDPWIKEIWFYDYRTNIHHTLKKNPLQLSDFRTSLLVMMQATGISEKKHFMQPIIPKGDGGSLVMMRSLPVIKRLWILPG